MSAWSALAIVLMVGVMTYAMRASVIVALGHTMPSRATLLSAVGECSLVCLLSHLCLWALLWPAVWEAVEASSLLTPVVLPLLVLLACSMIIQLATSFQFGLTAPLLGRCGLRLPTIRPPAPRAFGLSWFAIFACKAWTLCRSEQGPAGQARPGRLRRLHRQHDQRGGPCHAVHQADQ